MLPLRRWYERVGRFNLCRRSLYSSSLYLGINLVARYRTFSRAIICLIKYGLHTWFVYSICGRTRDLETVEKHLSSRYSKVYQIIPIIELALLFFLTYDMCLKVK